MLHKASARRDLVRRGGLGCSARTGAELVQNAFGAEPLGCSMGSRNEQMTYEPNTGDGPMRKPILVIDHHRASFPIVRGLHNRGHKVYAALQGDSEYVNWSRFVAGSVWTSPLDADPDRAAAELNAIFACNSAIGGVYSVDETGVRFFAEHGHKLNPRITQYAPPPDVVKACVNKSETADLCDRVGVEVAPRAVVDNWDDLVHALGEVGFPLVVKPDESNHRLYGEKVILARSREDFDAQCQGWPPEEHKRLIVQRMNEGNRHNLYWIAEHGRITMGVEIEALQTHSADHAGFTTYAVSVEPHERLTYYCHRLVEATGYHGAGSAQMLLDRSKDEICFLEINPRLDASVQCVEAMGLPFVQYGCDVIEGLSLPKRDTVWDYPLGQRFIWLKGENHAYKRLFSEKRFGALAARLAGNAFNSLRSSHAVFSWDDPFPALGCHLNPLISRLPQGLLPRQPKELEKAVMRKGCSDPDAVRAILDSLHSLDVLDPAPDAA